MKPKRKLTRNQKLVQDFVDGVSMEWLAKELVRDLCMTTAGALSHVEGIIRRALRKGKR